MTLLRNIVFITFAAWFVNQTEALDWQDFGTHRLSKIENIKTSPDNANGFNLLQPRSTGLLFVNKLSRQLVARNRNLANGSGVAIGDIDGDDLPDLYFCGLQTDNKLYRNNGDWTFTDITAQSGVSCPRQYSTGALIEDVDGDGDNDLLVTGLSKGTRLFLNNGNGQFSEKKDSGLFEKLGATSMSMADFDMDGDLDLYVTNYRTTNYKDRPPGVNVDVSQENGKIIVEPSNRFTHIKSTKPGGVNVVELGEPDFLYENLGAGKFKPVSWLKGRFLDVNGTAIVKPPLDWGLSVLMRDFNNDQLPDIYVCNDYFYSVDKFWINQGSGIFKLADYRTIRNFSMSSMSVDCADINLDGFDDFFVADMLSIRMDYRHTQRANTLNINIKSLVADKKYQPELGRNTLQLNRGNGTYAEIAQYAGLAASEWTWSSRFLDVDLDGYQDLILTTGNEADVLDSDMLKIVANAPRTREGHFSSMMKYPRLKTPNLIFRNNGNLTFTNESNQFGFNGNSISHGMAVADLDNDGDLDIAINNLNEPAFIYENIGSKNRIAVRLNSDGSNTHGVGSVITATSNGLKQKQTVVSGGRYLSGDQPLCVFGTPGEESKIKLNVLWPDGSETIINDVPTNTYVEINNTNDAKNSIVSIDDDHDIPIFTEVKRTGLELHKENEYDDFELRPLLSSRHSTLGPCLSVVDVDGDLVDELFMGGSKGGQIYAASFSNKNISRGESVQWGNREKLIRDTLFLLPVVNGQDLNLIATQTNYEDGLNIGNSLVQYSKNSIKNIEISNASSGGAMAMADIDMDGDLDLFIGGGITHNNNYLKSTSVLYLNVKGEFKPDVDNAALRDTGAISGAIFADIDNDQDPDLVLSRRWNSPMILINQDGVFKDESIKWGLSSFHGIWNAVSSGDFNNDGLIDLVISNIGNNSIYNQFIKDEVRMYIADYNRDGFVEGVETVFDPYLKKRVPFRDRDTLGKVMPWVLDMYQSYKAFSKADIDSIIEPMEKKPVILKINTLGTSLFINKGSEFSRTDLPVECQFSPAFGSSIADFNGDGNEDVFLAQNFYDVEPETSRYDAGLGQLLLGTGDGMFISLNSSQSGLAVFGQSRATVAADFNGDGRVDIAIAQNGDSPKVYFNQNGNPGLRVILKGGELNPQSIGSTITLVSDGNKGPRRENRLGTGYLSHSSLCHVFANIKQNSKFHIKWPDSKVTAHFIPKEAKTITISQSDGVKVVN